MISKGLIALLLMASLSLSMPEANAENHALLIGVGDYDNPKYSLKGPGNDVRMMADILEKRGFSPNNIHVLTDPSPENQTLAVIGRATHAAILTEFSTLAKRVDKDDFVYLHFSGHGSLQPDLTPDGDPELDGLDEIFLPADTGSWNGGIASVENALVDDEIAQFIEDMRSRGAFVWAVFDACNSGTMTRGAGDAVKRGVDELSLGIPLTAIQAAREEAAKADTGRTRGAQSRTSPISFAPESQGGLVAFFAARSGQPALERLLPRQSREEDKKMMGVFTYVLLQALNELPDANYRQIAQRMIQLYDTIDPGVPTPLFEGDLDTRVFAAQGSTPTHSVSINADGLLQLDAGLLSGLTLGSIIALYPFGQKLEQRLGYAQIEEIGMNYANLKPVAREGLPQVETTSFPTLMSAALIERAVDFQLRVALPPESDLPEAADRNRMTIIKKLAEEAHLPIVWQQGPGADLYLRIADGALWYIPSSGDWQQTGRGATPSDAFINGGEARVTESLQQIAKFHNLLRIYASPESSAALDDLMVQTFLLQDRTSKEGAMSDRRGCPKVPTQSIPEDANPVSIMDVPNLSHCDTLYLEITNLGSQTVDLTPLFLGSQYGVFPAWKTGSRALPPGGLPATIAIPVRTWNMRTNMPDTVGTERMMLISAVRPEGNAIAANFSHLAQKSIATRSTIRGPASAASTSLGGIGGLLTSGAFATPKTRGSTRSNGTREADIGISLVRWTTIPPGTKTQEQ